MGFLDIFKKQPKNNVKGTPQPIKREKRIQNPNSIEYSCTEDGRLVVELYEPNPGPRQFYDTTKLIIDNRVVDLDGRFVQNCMLAWYGQDDAIHLNSRGHDLGRRNQFRNILAEIDKNLLFEDESYCLAVMKQLLNQNRVEQYLSRGLEDTPEIPCGKYVGGIEQTSEGYEKMFYRNLGKASHYSREMCNKRQIIKEEIRRSREAVRAKKQAQIARLQQELEDDDMWR